MLAVRYQLNFKTANATSRVILNQYQALEANFKRIWQLFNFG